ncbi:hypothetical protein C5F53_04150 [Rhodoferax sp. TS-BS-61-7]|nr:hypothetical protein C5F53_04150 [Rhodoferax sp. TS-BS-61-7]
MGQTRVSSFRVVAVLVGLGILALAGYKLWMAIEHAMTSGAVLLAETTRSPDFRGAVWSYRTADAWAYFAGWLLVGIGGGSLAISCSKRLWPLLLMPVLFLGGFILIAAAPMLGTVKGVALLLGVMATGIVGAVAFARWSARRQEREHIKQVVRSGEGEHDS